MSVRVAFACAVVLASSALADARAQGFGGQSYSYRLPSTSPYAAAAAYSRYEPSGGGGSGIASELALSGGTYRTLCVRTCDGFYFPISYATTGGGVSRDAGKCEASCGSQGRLFYHPNPGGDVGSMVDLTGQAYSVQPFAFRYRKTLVKGCACQPQPWVNTEMKGGNIDGPVPASDADAGGFAVRPQPVARDAEGHAPWPFRGWASYGAATTSRYVWPSER